KPGGLTKFGMDPDAVAERYPHLVHASITGFGTTGGAHLPGYDLLAQAASGLMDITGEPESPGQKAGVAIFDVVTGLHATVGILGALQEREHSGKGQHIAVNLMSSALSGLVNQTSAYAAGEWSPPEWVMIIPRLPRMGLLPPRISHLLSPSAMMDNSFGWPPPSALNTSPKTNAMPLTRPATSTANTFALNLSIICSTTPQAGG